jgi:low temperature requirement protein LtrA
MDSPARPRKLQTVLRGETASVTPLELFFDLIFVLALTQCTALMAHEPTWLGLAKGTMVLGMLWWSWVGYSWLTSVIDPEEGPVRIAMFAAMASFLVASLCVPEVYGDLGLLFAASYGVVRIGQIVLFVLASGDDPGLRRAVLGLAVSTTIGVSLLVAAAYADAPAKLWLWLVALVLDVGGPFVIDASGWRLSAEHFGERHGLIVIIALGESIVAIGVGSSAGVTVAVVVAAVLGLAVCAALWWVYFDVVALVATQRLEQATPGEEQNSLARDSFSYLHFPMVAGIVLLALGLKKTLGYTDHHLTAVTGFALYGGCAIYLLALAAVRRRNIGQFHAARLSAGVALLALVPMVVRVSALEALALLAALLIAFVAYETRTFAESRVRIRSELRH